MPITPPKFRILFINGSLGGAEGNTFRAATQLENYLRPYAVVDWLHLRDHARDNVAVSQLEAADGFVWLSGTYWDSWGSPLQEFLERSTDLEAGQIWLGKPTACFITAHSVGGKGVLSRLQGVLCTLGLEIPPMTGMVYTLANHLALQASAPGNERGHEADLWQLADLGTIGENLLLALRRRHTQPTAWKTWPIDGNDPSRDWLSD